MRRKEQGPWILMTFWGKDCLNISMKDVWYPHFLLSFCIELNCIKLFFVFTRLLNCFNGEGFHFSWGCPKRKIFARSFIFHQSTSCQNSLWVWGTNWMQCNFLSFESNSGLNGHNIIRLKPMLKLETIIASGVEMVILLYYLTVFEHWQICSFISLWQFWVWIKLLRSSDSS